VQARRRTDRSDRMRSDFKESWSTCCSPPPSSAPLPPPRIRPATAPTTIPGTPPGMPQIAADAAAPPNPTAPTAAPANPPPRAASPSPLSGTGSVAMLALSICLRSARCGTLDSFARRRHKIQAGLETDPLTQHPRRTVVMRPCVAMHICWSNRAASSGGSPRAGTTHQLVDIGSSTRARSACYVLFHPEER
jgi:hypothetical protein